MQQREGMALNRRPEIAAALRQSNYSSSGAPPLPGGGTPGQSSNWTRRHAPEGSVTQNVWYEHRAGESSNEALAAMNACSAADASSEQISHSPTGTGSRVAVDLGPAFRKSQLGAGNAGDRSLSGGSRTGGFFSDSQGAIDVRASRKKESIDNFKSKLSRLEKNKQDLENKMKMFDSKIKSKTSY